MVAITDIWKILSRKNFFESWWLIAVVYFALIIIFGIAYRYLLTDLVISNPSNYEIIDGLYFSVVTMSTLGYGDTLPKSDILKALVSLQTILGVGLFGLLINSFWVAKQKSLENRSLIEKIKFHLFILEEYISQYKLIIGEITADDSDSFAKLSNDDVILNFDFKFSALSSIFDDVKHHTLVHRFGFNQSKIRVFYNIEDALVKELRNLKVEWNLRDQPELKSAINNFISLESTSLDRNVLLRYDEGDSFLTSTGPMSYKEEMKRTIKEYGSLPSKEQIEAAYFSEIALLYQSLIKKIACINLLEERIKEIHSQHPDT